MGITWKAMPLLSTLAALVIIVHSAEEDMDRGLDWDYRYDIRPRVLDTGTPSYDQPWRAVEAEPMMQKSTLGDIWEDSPERPMKRRKPARKRKRRPYAEEQLAKEHSGENQRSEKMNVEPPEAVVLQEATQDKHVVQRYLETDEPLRYRDTQYNPESTTEMPRRRRKRPENRRNRWTEDYLDIDRPLRRRVQRRKRPALDNSPKLSEFSETRQDDEGVRLRDYVIIPEPDEPYDFDDIEDRIPNLNRKHNKKYQKRPQVEQRDPMHLKEDKSLSEFSMEEKHTTTSPQNQNEGGEDTREEEDNYNKGLEKVPAIKSTILEKLRNEYRVQLKNRYRNHLNQKLNVALLRQKGYEKRNEDSDVKIDTQENYNSTRAANIFPKILSESFKNTRHGVFIMPFFAVNDSLHQIITEMEDDMNLGDRPIDPVTLKEILKRSNGTSLSEILQQHNLSLSDLLRGKEDAMAMVKNEKSQEADNDDALKKDNMENNLNANEKELAEFSAEQKVVTTATEAVTDNNEPNRDSETNTNKPSDLESQSTGTELKQENSDAKENAPKMVTTRRNPGIRRKLRMRPSGNGTYKSQLNRDLMAQTARKYHNSRNITKSKEWKYVIPMMNTSNSSEEKNGNKNEVIDITTSQSPTTTTSIPEETTIIQNAEYNNPTTIQISTQTDNEDEDMDKETTAISTTQETTTIDVGTTTTEKPKVVRLRPPASRMGLRRQALNNRLKRKRMKQKNSTTQSPAERNEYDVDLFGIPNLVSSSEFIARTQTPKPANTVNNEEDFTTLDDFMTTDKPKHTESGPRFTRNSTSIREELEPVNAAATIRFVSTTEETAKFEIEEILNDTRTSARLSRILMERNMTLNELVEHRERGSSHVHLADIFHNASKEPNPPEPFLSKSSIEPISKETYPLRAILEANLHDSNAKATTIDPMTTQTYAGNIPVVMDFGNNVNENGENMGIMSLFNKITDDIGIIEESTIGKDSEGTPYITTVVAVNNTDTKDTTARESRVLKNEENNLKHDVVGWNELFELMRKNHQNITDDSEALEDTPLDHHILLQDTDGDGLLVLEDIQRLKDLNVNTEEKLDINSYEADAAVPGILDKPPSHTRSITVATASIVGLAMILFLLTYAAFKWKQQRNLLRKKQNFSNDRIPTPVFENRKGHKNNSSTRSISPMLATSNIYTLSTLDSNGKESPDYMWDSLRKPFQ